MAYELDSCSFDEAVATAALVAIACNLYGACSSGTGSMQHQACCLQALCAGIYAVELAPFDLPGTSGILAAAEHSNCTGTKMRLNRCML
jgi:hypothetical protein